MHAATRTCSAVVETNNLVLSRCCCDCCVLSAASQATCGAGWSRALDREGNLTSTHPHPHPPTGSGSTDDFDRSTLVAQSTSKVVGQHRLPVCRLLNSCDDASACSPQAKALGTGRTAKALNTRWLRESGRISRAGGSVDDRRGSRDRRGGGSGSRGRR
jgi:hypothetical protein